MDVHLSSRSLSRSAYHDNTQSVCRDDSTIVRECVGPSSSQYVTLLELFLDCVHALSPKGAPRVDGLRHQASPLTLALGNDGYRNTQLRIVLKLP